VKRRRAAEPYAKALCTLARERNQTELIGRELGDAAVTFESVPELRDFFARPWIPATAKRSVAKEVAQRSGLSKLTTDFLALVAERGRADHLNVIAEKHQKLPDEDLGRVRAALPIFREIMLRTYQQELVGSVPSFPREIEDGIDQYLMRYPPGPRQPRLPDLPMTPSTRRRD
jgi:hypothetical protein